MPTKSWKNHLKKLLTYGSWEVFFSAAPTAQNSPGLHFRFINSFIQPSHVGPCLNRKTTVLRYMIDYCNFSSIDILKNEQEFEFRNLSLPWHERPSYYLATFCTSYWKLTPLILVQNLDFWPQTLRITSFTTYFACNF